MENTIEDKKLECKTCMKEFVWSKQDQNFYAKKGFMKVPQKCPDCRKRANELRPDGKFYIRCAFCEKDAVFISAPPKDKVAICADCLEKVSKKFKEAKPA